MAVPFENRNFQKELEKKVTGITATGRKTSFTAQLLCTVQQLCD